MDSTRKETKLAGLHLVCWCKLGNFLQVGKLTTQNWNLVSTLERIWYHCGTHFNATNLHTKPAKFMRATFPSCLCMYLLVFSYLLCTYIVVNCKVYKQFFFLILKKSPIFLAPNWFCQRHLIYVKIGILT